MGLQGKDKGKFRGYFNGNLAIELDIYGMTLFDVELMFAHWVGPIKITTKYGKILVDRLEWPNGDVWICT